jgi:hypothetical protein
MPVKVDK